MYRGYYERNNANDGILNGFLKGSNEFMNSNSIITNFAFVILVIFLFLIFLQFSVNIMYFFFSPRRNPHLIDGMVDAKQMHIIEQDPRENNAIPVMRSINQKSGIEFTWSLWMFIKDDSYDTTNYRHVFHKGDDKMNFDSDEYHKGIVIPNNAPGLYLKKHDKDPKKNDNVLVVVMNTFEPEYYEDVKVEDVTEEIEIPNVPMNKWVNVMIVSKNKYLDVYINGVITKRRMLKGVPRQNYGDVYMGMNGGFLGYISNLWYYDYAIGTREIARIIQKGPNKKMVQDSSLNAKKHNYLSLNWFFGANEHEPEEMEVSEGHATDEMLNGAVGIN